ncbi:IclR family transcriptional regulator [Bacilliculturomica massiliensis]|uniref:IclR family transcriptional regulator n=1 Tax=Bacilliculturomica massiliensis TaxID=1917867 RepID=UPI0010301D09|nr:IclR family transcriptional regulator [Bacilliculturomica massiliensis]
MKEKETRNTTKNIQSIERMHAILSCFKNSEELGITEISNAVGLHKSTTNGIVSTLKNIQFLEQNPDTGRYRLGVELFRLNTYSRYARISVKEVLAPYVKKLAEATKETVTLHIWDDGVDGRYTTTVIAMTESSHSVKYVTKVGSKILCHCSAVGKAILAFLPEREKNAILDQMALEAVSPHSITDRGMLEKELEAVRKRGYGLNLEETEEGVIGVAVAIFDSKNRPKAGIGIAAPMNRMPEEICQQYGRMLVETHEEIRKNVFLD